MTEKKKNPTPQELAKCFIEHVRTSNDKHHWYHFDYTIDECMRGMDLTYFDEESGWTPLTVAIARASRYFGQHSPYDYTLKVLLGMRDVTLDDMLKKTNKDQCCALHYALKYPKTFKKVMALLFMDGEKQYKYLDDFNFYEYRSPVSKRLLESISTSPKYDEKRIFSPEFWKAVGTLDSDNKMLYRDCPGFKAEWLLDDYKYFKDGGSFEDSTLSDALNKFGTALLQDPKLQPKVDELKAGVKGLNLEYSCYSHYQSGHFGGPRFHDYDGSHLTPNYLENLNQNYPNIERISLPQYESYKREDFHYTMENEFGDSQFEAISKFKNVKDLVIGYQPHMKSMAFGAVAEMKNLESISFSNMGIGKAELEKLLKLPKLKELSLDKCIYDAELIRKKTNLLQVGSKWVGPEHPDYKQAKQEEAKRLAEIARVQSLTGKDWKDKFHEAMAEGRKYDAIEILKLNHVFDKRTETHDSSWGRDKPEDVGPHTLQRWGVDSMTVRNDCLSQDIVELGGENIAIATLYEDRDWHSNVGYSGGVGWYWNGEVAVVNLDQGVGQIANTGSLCVRHPTNSYRDIFDNIDKKDILHVENGKAIVRLGGYSSANVDIPKVSKKEDVYLRDKQAERLKELRRGTTLKDALKKGETGRSKAVEEAKKFHSIRSQITALKFKRVREE